MSTHPSSLCIDKAETLLRRLYPGPRSGHYDHAVTVRLQMHIVKRTTELANEVLRPHGLTQVGFSLLMMLLGADDEPMNPSQAGEMLGESRANMTRLCDDLVARGLVARAHSATDRRRLVLSATPAGERLARKMLPLLDARVSPSLAGFNRAERAALIGLLKRQLRALEPSETE